MNRPAARRSATASLVSPPCFQLPLRSPQGAPVDLPPWSLHRLLPFIAGQRQGFPARLRAWRFAGADVFVRALAAFRPGSRVLVADSASDVSPGALRLFDPALVLEAQLRQVEPLPGDLAAYREGWRSALETKP